jgi:hypothetical protein
MYEKSRKSFQVVLWYMPVITALRSLKQEDCEASWGYIESLRIAWATKHIPVSEKERRENENLPKRDMTLDPDQKEQKLPGAGGSCL